MNTLRRFITWGAFAFWMGGFTFYGGVVIPIGTDVLGGHREVGFVTQQVSNWLNVAAVGTLALLTWNWLLARGQLAPRPAFWLRASLIFMAATQAVLFAVHPILDGMLDRAAHTITDIGRFDAWHRVYLITASVQWCGAVVHAWVLAAPAARAARAAQG